MESCVGRYVKVFLKNGHIFHGSVLSWEEKVELKSIQNEIIIIPDVKEICAYVFIKKPDGKFLIDEGIKEIEKEIDKDNLESVDFKQEVKIKNSVELHKLKIESEKQLAKIKLKSPTITAAPVEYGDTVSILRTFKNDSSK